MCEENRNLTVLTTLYNNVRMEITRYRNYEWKITAYIGGLFVWIISMVSNNKLVGTCSDTSIKLLWAFITFATLIFALRSLHYVHIRLNRQRNLRTKIEIILHLFEPKYYLPSNFKTPEGWGWDKTDFDQLLERGHMKKIPGFSEERGVEFIIVFMIFLSILALYAVGIIILK